MEQLPALLGVLATSAEGVSDRDARGRAESTLLEMAHSEPEFFRALLTQISSNNDVSLVAARVFRTHLNTEIWEGLPVASRDHIKESCLPTLTRSSPPVRSIMYDVVQSIARWDIPSERWNSLIPHMCTIISTKDETLLSGALLCLRCVIRNYEYTSSHESKERNILNQLVSGVFPTLEVLSRSLFERATVEAEELKYHVIKILWSSTQMALPAYFQHSQNIDFWIRILQHILDGVTQTNQLPSPYYWKLRQRAVSVFFRWLTRHTDTKMGKYFLATWAPTISQSLINIVSFPHKGGYIPPKMSCFSLRALGSACQYSSTFAVLKGSVPTLLEEVAFKFLCYSEEEARCFTETPLKYLDIIDGEFDTPRAGAVSFILDCCKYRGKTSLNKFMSYLSELLKKNPAGHSQTDSIKFGVLSAISHLSDKLLKNAVFSSSMEMLLSAHAFPELSSANSLLRSKACEVFASLASMEFHVPAQLGVTVLKICQLTTDQSIPVSFHAIMALDKLKKNGAAKELISPHILEILSRIMTLLQETRNEDLLTALQGFIEEYPQTVLPYAEPLCVAMATSFQSLATKLVNGNGNENNNDIEEEEEDTKSEMVAVSCLETIMTILDTALPSPQLLPRFCSCLLPLFELVLQNSLEAFFDDTIRIITRLTMESPLAVPWRVFDLLTSNTMFIGDYPDWAVSLINFVCNDTEGFLANPDYSGKILQLFKEVLTGDVPEQSAMSSICSLSEAVLQFCKGRVNLFASEVLRLTVEQMRRCTVNRKLTFQRLFANGLVYDPVLCLSCLEPQDSHVILELTSHIQKMGKFHQKITLLGLCSVLRTSRELLPQNLTPHLKVIALQAIDLADNCSDEHTDLTNPHSVEDPGEDEDEVGDRDNAEEDDGSGAEELDLEHINNEQEEEDIIGSDEEDNDVDPASPVAKMNALAFFHDTMQGLSVSTWTPEEKMQLSRALLLSKAP
ncbi:Armadillo-type fold [Pelomyxa schiedti]|nr:Armadillo-type fold [Pelomyxa schiedti]